MCNREEMSEILKKVLDQKLAPLHIDKQQHYADHLKIKDLEPTDIIFLKESRQLVVSIKDSFWKTFIRVIVITGLGLMTCGIYTYFKYYSKP